MKTRFALLTAVALGLAAPAFAQDQIADHEYRDSLGERLSRTFEEEMGHLTLRYWELRLDDYKHRVDEIFTPHDLEGLNELRVRFTIFLEKMLQEERERAEHHHPDATTIDTATTMAYAPDGELDYTDTVAYDMSMESAVDTAYVTPYAGVPEQYDSAEYARREAEYAEQYQREYRARVEDEMAANEAALARGEQIDAESWLGVQEDFVELPLISRWLARRYRSNLDPLAEQVFRDLEGFQHAIDSFATAFRAANAKDLALVPESLDGISMGSDFEGLSRLLRYPHLLKHTYVNQIEPLFLLYDGGGLERLVGTMMRRPSGGGLVERSMLGQSSPNPAASTATIAFTLPEPSSATVLRVFNTQGAQVLELEQGALPAGEHSVVLDVSTLASGSYLYQLTAQLPAGEKTSARILQVAR